MSRSPATVPLWAVLLLLVPGAASAQGLLEGLTAILDTTVSSTATKTTNTTSGTVTKTSFDTVYPRLTLNADTLVLPSLRLSVGGIFEVNALFADLDGGNTTIARLRPFVELRSTSPILAPGVGYYRRENRTSVAGFPSLNLVSEDYAAYLAWRPAGLPQTDLQFIRTDTFDTRRDVVDNTRDFGSIISRYTYNAFNAYYLGSSIDTTDRANGVHTAQVSNAGRLDYSQSLIGGRLLWNATYNVDHLTLTTEASGNGGEVAMPVLASGGLSALSDTPVTARLSPNPLLVDSNLAASAGINLGVPPVGADAQARNIGLDFLNPTEVSRLLVWIDRELPTAIANTFSWEIYSSPDNLLWTRETLVPTAQFGPFENRFQLDFRSITARYLKVVTRPLSSAVPDASRYPDILVTELQAFVVRPAGELRGRVERTAQNLNTDVRYRILDTPMLYYEGSYWFNDTGTTSADRHLLSNGLSFTHRLGRMFGAYGRGALEQGTLPEGERVATVTNATLTFDPIPAFTGSLLYTGQDERIDDRPNDRRSLSLQTNSQVYRGVDVQFGFGWNFVTRETGEELRDRFLSATATIVPRPTFTLTFSYADSTITRTGDFIGAPEYHTRRALATLAYDPFRTLHLVVAQELTAGDGEQTRVFTNVGVNWAPMPDGTLQVYFAYNESFRPLEYGTERNWRPGFRWRFARQSFVDVAYERYRTEFVFQTTDTRIVSANVRLFF